MRGRKTLKRTVFYDEESDSLCSCSGDFWKTCSLRVAHDLPCTESIVSITSIDRGEKDPADSSVRSLDKRLSNLNDQLRNISKKLKI